MAPKQEESPWNEETSTVFETKSYSKFYDPCQEFAEKSYRCLTRNNGDKEFCKDYFEAYRECKKQWQEKRREEKKKKGSGLF